jgi:hypothetical protein
MHVVLEPVQDSGCIISHDGYNVRPEDAVEARFAFGNGFFGMRAVRSVRSKFSASRDTNHSVMRKPTASLRYLTLLLPLLLATCAAPTQWKKAGVDDATIAKDTSACRVAARDEALRRYPYAFSGSPSLGAGGMVVSQQRDDTHRSVVEAASFSSCMQDKGYAQTSSSQSQ